MKIFSINVFLYFLFLIIIEKVWSGLRGVVLINSLLLYLIKGLNFKFNKVKFFRKIKEYEFFGNTYISNCVLNIK